MHGLLQESLNALLSMRRNSKEKELEALLAGENDSSSCYIEVRCEFSYLALLMLTVNNIELQPATF